MSHQTLHETTLELLKKSKIPLSQVATESRVGYRWLCDFVGGRFADPGVNKVERIHKFLTESEAQPH